MDGTELTGCMGGACAYYDNQRVCFTPRVCRLQGAVRSSSAARKRSPDKGDGTRRQPLSEVLLVGGATRMPAVRRFVRNMTGVEPR